MIKTRSFTTKIFPAGCWLFISALLAASCGATETGLQPFTSDGCSRFPDGTLYDSQRWLSCCTEHDLAYWQGGTYSQRIAADNALKQCVWELDEPVIALVMRVGVFFGGSALWPTEFRWGYGWPYGRGYGALTSAELEQVKQQLSEQRQLKSSR